MTGSNMNISGNFVNPLHAYSKTIYILILFFSISHSLASEHNIVQDSVDDSTESEQIVEYQASFFNRYQPDNALDMVRQLPGFLLSDGTSERGFIGAVGNILINDNYPSIKQDTPSSILSRIPANQVEKIELIRGQVRGIDLQNQVVVANIILHENSDATVRWQTFLQKSTRGPYKPGANISLAHSIADIEYNIGFMVEREANGERGPEFVFNSEGDLIETRFDRERQIGIRRLGITLNASTTVHETLVKFNGKVENNNGPDNQFRTVTDEITGIENKVYFKDSRNRPTFELGLDAERALNKNLSAKAILLYTYHDLNLRNFQSVYNPAGTQILQRIAEPDTLTQEGIGRLEIDWDGFSNHNIQFNFEGAYNSVDQSFLQTVDTGSGSVVVNVPGANSKVEELRGDFELKDTWDLDRLELDVGLGAEISDISQSGDNEQRRDFFFIKPQFIATYTSSDVMLTRLLVARDVAQLNFNDFISATVFEDDDLALGNPNLRPDKKWILELSHEKRFGELGVLKLTAFHHWITDLLDLLPLSDTFEAPGNIGNARKWGIIMESTLPLEWLGLSSARLDLKARWQDSTVIDPVTGQNRVLSATQIGFGGPPAIRFRDNGSEYVFDIAFRQDLDNAKIAWGWDMAAQGNRPRFKVNELEIFDEGLELNVFIESTRWLGVKVRLEARNLLNYVENRDRTLYNGRRGLSIISSRILRQRTPGSRLVLFISGNF
jgi:hypothetical protein